MQARVGEAERGVFVSQQDPARLSMRQFGARMLTNMPRRKEDEHAAQEGGCAIPMSRFRPAVVALLPDLFFAARVADVIRAQGGEPVLVDTPSEFVDAVDHYYPVLALVDLGTGGDWEDAIRRVKSRPHTRNTPVYAWGSHVDAATLRAARQAGADHAWARSRMMEELPNVIGAALSPPVRYPDGWDSPLSEAAQHGVTEFNRGEYFEQHEWFEKAWLEEPRPVREMYQGILQVGVAFLQIERRNWAGAIKMFRRGLPRLRALPDTCQGINIAALRVAAEAIHAEITALGPERIAEWRGREFPRIELVDHPPLYNTTTERGPTV